MGPTEASRERHHSPFVVRACLLVGMGLVAAMLPSLLVASDAPAPANGSASLHRLAGPLQFNPPVVTVPTTLEDDTVIAKFPFTNTSTDTVTIQEVLPRCAGMTADITKHEFTPGETGTISAILDVTNLLGSQHKRIEVSSQSGKQTYLQDLYFQTDVPSPISTMPNHAIVWMVGQDTGPKSMDVSLVPGAVLQSIEQPDLPYYSVTVTPGADPQHLQLIMTPTVKDLKTSATTLMHVHVQLTGGRERRIPIWGIFIVRTQPKP